MDYYSKSLDLHKDKSGKIEIKPKIEVKNKEDLSVAYTPGVARVCEEIHKDLSNVYRYTIKKNTVAVVSDGSAVLGLGNIGAEASIPVMEGKALLFKEFADIDAFPVCLRTQDVDEIVTTVKNIAPVFGAVNLEDISAPRCFEVLDRLKSELDIPVMHDDQQGTAVVVLAGIINSLKLIGKDKDKIKILISGSGAAGIAITKLLLKYGFKNIVLFDSQGAIYQSREGLNQIKKDISLVTNLSCVEDINSDECIKGDMSEAFDEADVFIGVSKAGIVTQDNISKMRDKPVIFALANPEPEIMPDLAKEAGAYIVATGRSDFENQVNNLLAFPGIFRGVLDGGIKQITDDILIYTAEILADYITPNPDMIIPNPLDKKLAFYIAEKIVSKFG